MKPINKIEVYNELQKELQDRKQNQPKPFHVEDFIIIEYDQENHWVYVDWKGYQTEQSVMTGCERMLDAVVLYKCTKILNDNTNVVGIWTPAANWVGVNWFPRIQAAGVSYFAWVYSPSAMSRVSTDEALKNTVTPDFIRTFFDINAAKSWLHSPEIA